MIKLNINKIQQDIQKGIDIREHAEKIILHIESSFLRFWLVNVVLDYITLLEMSEEKSNKVFVNQNKSIKKNVQYIKQLMSSSDKWLEANQKAHSNRLSTLNKHKEGLTKQIKVLTTYGDKLKINEYIIQRAMAKYDNNYIDIQVDEEFVGDLIRFIFADNDNIVINDKIKTIYSQLPIRMTKNRFYNYVEASIEVIKGVSKGQMKQYREYLQDVFCPEHTSEYGNEFELLLESFTRLDALDVKNLTEIEVANGQQVVQTLSENIDNALNYSVFIVSVINEITGLLMTINQETLEANSANVEQFNEILMTVFNNLQGGELIDENLGNQLLQTEGIMEETIHEIDKYSSLLESININYKEQLGVNLSKRLDNINKMKAFMVGNYFVDQEDDLDSEYMSQVDALFLSRTKNEIVNYMSEVFKNDSKEVQRARMANMFLNLNITHKKTQEIYNFILDALISCNDENEKNTSKRLIREVIKEYNV